MIAFDGNPQPYFTVTEANKDKVFSAFKYKLRALLHKNKEEVVSTA